MALLTAIEVSNNCGGWVSISKSFNKGQRELKKLACSIHYDSMGGSSSRSRVKVGGDCYSMKPKLRGKAFVWRRLN
jgi:hypothetical protein